MLTMKKPTWMFDQFEPFISTTTMLVHVDQLHNGYINKLNKRFGNTDILSVMPSNILKDPDAFLNIDDKQFYIDQMGGNVTHTLFWQCISPTKNAAKTSRNSQFLKAFNITHEFLAQKIVEEGLKRFGSGWVWGALTRDNQLALYSTKNHDTPYMRKQRPVFCIDVWEHAYFIDRFGDRESWLKNICTFINYETLDKVFLAHLEGKDILDTWVTKR